MEIPKTTKLQRFNMTLKATFKILKKKFKKQRKTEGQNDEITPQTVYVPSFVKYSSYLTFLRLDVYSKYPKYVDKVEEWCDIDEIEPFIKWMNDEYLYITDVNKFVESIVEDALVLDLHKEIMSMCPKFQETVTVNSVYVMC